MEKTRVIKTTKDVASMDDLKVIPLTPRNVKDIKKWKKHMKKKYKYIQNAFERSKENGL